MNKIFKTSEEITKAFVNNGWSKDTTFSELTLEEVERKGYAFAMSGMAKGRQEMKRISAEKLLTYNYQDGRFKVINKIKNAKNRLKKQGFQHFPGLGYS